jgi:uncharacterized protein (TIGR04255 family)
MDTSMTNILKYEHPPVFETVIGVHFPELAGFRPRHLYLYWETRKEQYPTIEERPRIREVVEAFPRRPTLREPKLSVSEGPPAERVWCITQPEDELIQIQPDWFLFNWRERPGSKYASFAENSQKFLEEFKQFREFCRGHALEDPKPRLCEVSYINHIDPEGGESTIELFGKVLTGLCWKTADGWLPHPEAATFNRVFVVGEQEGRLYAEAAIATRGSGKDARDFVLLKLTARVNHKSQDPDQIMSPLQVAHDWAVKGFGSLTDVEIQQKRWGRKA